MLKNYYRCTCGTEWENESDYVGEIDVCPVCEKEVRPYRGGEDCDG